MITKEECLIRMKALEFNKDYEQAHIEADELLIDFLKALGHIDIAEAYDNVGKWYA